MNSGAGDVKMIIYSDFAPDRPPTPFFVASEAAFLTRNRSVRDIRATAGRTPPPFLADTEPPFFVGVASRGNDL